MNKIKELKKYRGLTDKDIAQILSSNHGYYYSRVSISRWINGYYRCPEEVITVLAGPDLLDVDNEHLGELFDEVYSEKHHDPLDQICIDDEMNNCIEATQDYLTLADLCNLFQQYIPYPYLKFILEGFSECTKIDEYGRLYLSELTNEDIRNIMFPLWNSSFGQRYYDYMLLILYKRGYYKFKEDSHE